MGLILSWFRIFNFISIVTLTWGAGAKWPSSIKRCAMNDPDLGKCTLKMTEQAIAKMAKGVPAIGLRSLDPLRNVSFDIGSESGPVVLDVHMSNVVISGPSKVQLRKVNYDKKSSTYFIEGYHKLLKMVGNYKVKGSLLLIPIDSSGSFEYEMRGGFANHSVKMSNNVRSGGHGKVRFDLKSFKLMKINLHDRLIGEQGSAALSQLINDNMDIVHKALWSSMERVIQEIYGEALKPLMSKFTVKEFFPTSSSGRSEAVEAKHDDVSPTVPENVRSSDSYSYYIHYK